MKTPRHRKELAQDHVAGLRGACLGSLGVAVRRQLYSWVKKHVLSIVGPGREVRVAPRPAGLRFPHPEHTGFVSTLLDDAVGLSERDGEGSGVGEESGKVQGKPSWIARGWEAHAEDSDGEMDGGQISWTVL